MNVILRRLLSFLVVVICIVMLGCETYPLGMSKEEWESLTPQQQAEARLKQAEIDAERRRIAAEREAERQRLEAERRAAYEAMINERYDRAIYGDIIRVDIHDGQFLFRGKHYPYEPLSFHLVRGEAREIVIHRADRPNITVSAMVRLSEDGHTFYFDDASRRPVAIHNTGWQQLREHEVGEHPNSNAHPRNIHIGIRYRRLNEPPRR